MLTDVRVSYRHNSLMFFLWLTYFKKENQFSHKRIELLTYLGGTEEASDTKTVEQAKLC